MVICIVFFLLSTKSLGSVYLWNGIIKSWHWLPSLASWKWKWLSCVQLFATPCNVACQALLSMEISRQEHWSGLPCPPPRDLPIKGSNPGLLYYKQILYHLNHQGSPRILEWVAYPYSRGSSWPRNRAGVSCIAGRFFTSWATKEVLHM